MWLLSAIAHLYLKPIHHLEGEGNKRPGNSTRPCPSSNVTSVLDTAHKHGWQHDVSPTLANVQEADYCRAVVPLGNLVATTCLPCLPHFALSSKKSWSSACWCSGMWKQQGRANVMGMSSGDNRSLPCGIVSSIHMGGGDISLSLECPEFILKNFYWEREGSESQRYFHWYLQKTGCLQPSAQ